MYSQELTLAEAVMSTTIRRQTPPTTLRLVYVARLVCTQCTSMFAGGQWNAQTQVPLGTPRLRQISTLHYSLSGEFIAAGFTDGRVLA